MLFNSINFALFLPVVFVFYWLVKGKLRVQNLLLLVASYFFYGCWDYRFLFLLIFSTLLDYFTGIRIFRAEKQSIRKFWFWLSIGVNLGFLGLFKYFNFFIESFSYGLSLFGTHVDTKTLDVILPVGISFYTFHGLSYVIDIYYRRINPENDFINYAVFVSFFPLLVAGPIERATHLLPQIRRPRLFDYGKAVDGLRQILWGLFKKIVIADNCAPFVNTIFDSDGQYSGSTYLVGALLFAFQIYCDFSGYSDVALGVARLFGIELLRNFAFPYFSRDIAEFWRRWHISLSSWFKDYVYIPLGGSKGGTLFRIRNTLIIFILSGFWHGANWTFIFWGLLNAIYFLPLLVLNKNRKNTDVVAVGSLWPGFKDVVMICLTFFLTVLAWIFFRSSTVGEAFSFLGKIFSMSLFSPPEIFPKLVFVFIMVLVAVEWIQREREHGLAWVDANIPTLLRWSVYIGITALTVLYGASQQEFIYFQF